MRFRPYDCPGVMIPVFFSDARYCIVLVTRFHRLLLIRYDTVAISRLLEPRAYEMRQIATPALHSLVRVNCVHSTQRTPNIVVRPSPESKAIPARSDSLSQRLHLEPPFFTHLAFTAEPMCKRGGEMY